MFYHNIQQNTVFKVKQTSNKVKKINKNLRILQNIKLHSHFTHRE